MSETLHSLKNKFPNIKLSYETVIHKKVFNSQFICLIPQGIKCFLWFTFLNDNPCCFIVEKKNNQLKLTLTNCCFDKQLCYNTILYGTLIKYKQGLFYSIKEIILPGLIGIKN